MRAPRRRGRRHRDGRDHLARLERRLNVRRVGRQAVKLRQRDRALPVCPAHLDGCIKGDERHREVGRGMSSDLGYKDTDWLERARYGLIAVLAPVPSRSHTGAFCLKDPKGRALSGEHRYTITFDLSDMPPVTGVLGNPALRPRRVFLRQPNRSLLDQQLHAEAGKMHTADGKLVIYVQNDEPKDANQVSSLPLASMDLARH